MKQNVIMEVLRKTHSGLQIDKKINNVKEDPRRKTEQTSRVFSMSHPILLLIVDQVSDRF